MFNENLAKINFHFKESGDLMRTYMVIPSYWTGSNDQWEEGDKVFDHPTQLNEEGTLRRTLESLNILTDKDFTLIIIAIATNPRYNEVMEKKLKRMLRETAIPVDTILFTEKILQKLITEIYKDYHKEPILTMENYSQIRNLCLFLPYLLDGEIAMLIDDDEIFEDPLFITKAKEFVGKRFYGNTVDGVAGFYLNEDNEYYDKVNIVPWMTYWDRFGHKREAFDRIIGEEPRLKKTPFAFGGAMVIHRNLMRVVPFDPLITRGEDTDYVINSRIFGFNFYLDNKLSIKHLPPPKNHPIWKRFREDIYRFLYDKSKIETQSPKTNLHTISPEDFDPYPGQFLKPDLGDKIFKTNIILALNYLAEGNIEACKETLNNIYLARYEAIPHYNTFDQYLSFQKEWRKMLEYTKTCDSQLKDIVLSGIVIKYDKYLEIKSRILSEAGIKENIELNKIEMFKKFSKKELREILSISEMKSIIKGNYVFRDGDMDTGIYFLIKGQLEIRKKSRDLKYEYVVSKLNQGEHFNETAIFFTEPHRVSVYAVTDTKLMRIDKDKTLELMKKDTRLSNKLLWWISKKLTERLSQTTQKYSDSQERSTDLSDNMDS